MGIRNKEGYERLVLFVDGLMCDAIDEQGWSWLDDAMDPEVRADRLAELRDLVREERRSDKAQGGLSARKRWLEMAYDAAVRRLALQQPEHDGEDWEEEEDDLVDIRQRPTSPSVVSAPIVLEPSKAPPQAPPPAPKKVNKALISRALVDAMNKHCPTLSMLVSRSEVADALDKIGAGTTTAAKMAFKLAEKHGVTAP